MRRRGFGICLVAGSEASNGWLYRLHTRWFTLSRQAIDALHSLDLGLYKISNLLLHVPLLVECLMF
jgi:hypothetical protein